MNVEQLKNSVLQLAIQGKLVEQREEEGTAEELFQQIQLEKNQLIKEGKLKKLKPLPPINVDELPFEIPATWKWLRLGDICSTKQWKTLPMSKIRGGTYPVYGANGIIGYTDIYNHQEPTLLLTCRGATCGYTNISKPFSYINGNAFSFDQLSRYVSMHYLRVFFDAVDLYATGIVTGTAQPQITKSNLDPTLIPMPPLGEQNRIDDKIGELMPLIEEYGESYVKLEQLNKNFPQDIKQSILQYAIQGKLVEQREEEGTAEELYQKIQLEKNQLIKEGKLKKSKSLPPINPEEVPFDIPTSWKWVRHNELFEISGGSQPPKSTFKYTQLKGYIRLYQIRDYGENPQPTFIPESKASKVSKKGDILLARYGASLGKVFIAKDGAYNVAMAKVIPTFNSEFVTKKYLFNFYISSLYQDLLKNNSRSAQAGFNKEDLIKLLFPLPPISEQRRIVDKIEELLIITKALEGDIL